ncbi:MAG: hypothetical protein K0S88_5028 [Actinomycetia bacterium]|jgi:hypothetical protein|nr:hypothetical protein [Actinomycetes bacterium]
MPRRLAWWRAGLRGVDVMRGDERGRWAAMAGTTAS